MCRNCATIKNASKYRKCFNAEILLEESPITYYWIGFLLADGHLEKDGRICLTTSNKDIDHLLEFAKYIEFEGKIRDNRDRNAHSIMFKNISVCSALKNKFNIHDNKTISPPRSNTIFDNDLFKCLFIGFIDGDGSIQYQYDHKKSRISLSVHKNWINILEKFNQLFTEGLGKVKINTRGYANYSLCLTSELIKLKEFALRHKLPIIKRKWSKIDLNLQKEMDTRTEIRKDRLTSILNDLTNGVEESEILNKYNLKPISIYYYRRKLLSNQENE